MDGLPACYTPTWRYRPGDAVSIAAEGQGAARAEIVRLRGLAGRPMPTAYVEQPLGLAADLHLVPQAVLAGSYAITTKGPRAESGHPWAWRFCIYPTLTDRGAVLMWGDRVKLGLRDGMLELAGLGTTIALPITLAAWTDVDLNSDGAGNFLLRLTPIGPGAAYRAPYSAATHVAAAAMGGALIIGKDFNGKISGPMLTISGALAARWTFAANMGSQVIAGEGPQATPLHLVNAPRRAVTGPAWTGDVHDWRQAPAHYDAIHFHDDDLSDCAWPQTHAFDLPENTPSGVYAAKLSMAAGQHYSAFFVRPKTTPPVLFLASTFSYLAYANSLWASPSAARIRAEYPVEAKRMQRFGHSTYSRHRDGSGIGLVSLRRPILNLRPGFLGEAAGGQALLNDDLRILAWLDRTGEDYGVITDHDLHTEGANALDGCHVLVTGTHPEYHSRETLDAIAAFQSRGGRLIYMGGNGFYWRVSILSDAPHVMELRRAEAGIRMWAEAPGEYHHQSDGALGGLWRRIGRPPNRLVGVGYSAQGDGVESQPYRKTSAASNPRAAFLFAGVEGETFGHPHAGLGAAAGYELDRADTSLGTAPNALVVARSEPFSASLCPVNEERLTHTVLDADDPLRADLTFFETPAGGATLSAGSVYFALALDEHDGAGRIMSNALKRFCDPTPFALPQTDAF